MEKIETSVPSSFVYKDLKFLEDRGKGEGKLFIGSTNNLVEYNEFFEGFNEKNDFVIERVNLIGYLQQCKDLYTNGMFGIYKGTNEIYCDKQIDKIEKLFSGQERIYYKIELFTDTTRIYIRPIKKYKYVFNDVIRKIALPKITKVVIEKEDSKTFITKLQLDFEVIFNYLMNSKQNKGLADECEIDNDQKYESHPGVNYAPIKESKKIIDRDAFEKNQITSTGDPVTCSMDVKIGQYAQDIFANLIERDLIDGELLLNLQDAEYSRRTFHLKYPFLKKRNPNESDLEQRKDDNNYVRYYVDDYKIKGESYFFTKEWFSNQFKYLEPWYFSIINDLDTEIAEFKALINEIYERNMKENQIIFKVKEFEGRFEYVMNLDVMNYLEDIDAIIISVEEDKVHTIFVGDSDKLLEIINNPGKFYKEAINYEGHTM